MIDPLLEEGALPHLAALAKRGVTADLETVEPVISPVVWTSIATGRTPASHGISDFLKTGLDREVPSVFERLAAKGRRVGLYEYLLTWPPRTLPDGFVIPGWLRRDERTTPPDVLSSGAGDPRGAGYRYSLRGLRNREDYRENAREELARKAAQWNALVAAHPVEVGAVTFYAVDSLAHRYWHEPAVIRETLIGLDQALGQIAGALEPEDTLLVASDHGFQATDGVRRVWSGTLEKPLETATGLMPVKDPFIFLSQFGAIVIRVNRGPFEEREALAEKLATVLREATNARGEPLFRVDVLDEAERPPAARRSLWAQLRQWGLRRFARWQFNVRFDANAHAYVVAQYDADSFEGAWRDREVRFGGRRFSVEELAIADNFTGDHHPAAIFMAAGGPIRAIAERQTLSVLDVAPLVARLAGEPVPDDMEGSVPESFLSEAFRAAHPPASAAAASWPELPRLAETGLPVDDADLLERLRTMGYLR